MTCIHEFEFAKKLSHQLALSLVGGSEIRREINGWGTGLQSSQQKTGFADSIHIR